MLSEVEIMRCGSLVAALCLMGGAANAINLPNGFTTDLLAEGFDKPVAVAFPDQGRLFVAEKVGRVWIVENGVTLPAPLIDLKREVNNTADRGLLGMELHPDFARNGWIYLLYIVDPIDDGITHPNDAATFGRLVRYTVSGNQVVTNSRKVLLGNTAADGPAVCFTSHAIGSVKFAPDGSLFVGAGESAHWDFIDYGQDVTPNDPGCRAMHGASQDVGSFRAQTLDSLSGKLMRIDADTGLGLDSNPFYDGNPASRRSRVWAYGLRNPFRFNIRPGSPAPGTVYMGDVGSQFYEEINVSKGGENFGWPCYEGHTTQPDYFGHSVTGPMCASLPFSQVTPPVHAVPHGIDHATGGVVWYDAGRYPSAWRNRVFFTDYVQSFIDAITVDENDAFVSVTRFATDSANIVDLETDPDSGDLVYVSITTGEVRRIRYAGANLPPVVKVSASPAAGPAPLTVQLSSNGTIDPDGDAFTLSWDFGDGTPKSSVANPQHVFLTAGVFNVKLTATDAFGNVETRSVQVVTTNAPPVVKLTNPRDGQPFVDGESISFAATASDPEGGALSWKWEVDLLHDSHMHPDEYTSTLRSPPPFVAHAHGGTGERYAYRVTVKVTDAGGLTATDAAYLVPAGVANQAPVASFTATPDVGTLPMAVSFQSTSVDPDVDFMRFAWDFDDGTTGAGATTSHVYDAPGDYRVKLTVTDTFGASSSATHPVRVLPRGLLGAYFRGTNFQTPVFERVDSFVDFDWGQSGPDARLGTDTFSVRWTGFVTPRFSESYTFFATHDDGARLWVNGELIVDRWANQSAKETSGKVTLQAGVPVPVRFEYFENTGSAIARLAWSSARQAKEVVPESVLMPEDGFVTPPPPPPPPPPTGSLLLHWPLDTGSGSTALDASGNTINGSISGASWSAGRINGALSFNGVDGRVVVTDARLAVAGRLTLAAWVKIADPNQAANLRIFSKKSAWNAATGFELEYHPGKNHLTLVAGGEDVARAFVDLDTGWHHVAGVIDGTVGRLFVDGVDVTSDRTIGALLASTDALNIGREASGKNAFNGSLDDVRVYSTALSAGDIQALAGGSAPPPPGNRAPVASSASLSTTVGASVPVALVATDPDGDTLSFLVTRQPANGTLTGTLPSLVYKPNAGFEGVDNLTFKASDPSGLSDTAVVTIEVRAVSGGAGPVARFRLDEGAGSTTQGEGVSSSCTLRSATWGSGHDGSAVVFAGASSVACGASPEVAVAGSMTVAAWVRIADPNESAYMRVASKKVLWSDSNGWALSYNPSRKLLELLGSGDDSARGTVALDTGWHLVVAVAAGGTARLYVDGVDVTFDAALTPIVAGTAGFTIGRETGGSSPFHGSIDDVRVWDRALTIQEVGALR